MHYRERLWPSAPVWASVLVVSAGLGVVALPAGRAAGLVTGTVALLALAAAVLAWSPLVEADGDALRVGGTVLPVSSLTSVRVLDAATMRRLVGPELDARTRTVLRPGISTGLEVVAADGRWIVCCRTPAAAVRALGRSAATPS